MRKLILVLITILSLSSIANAGVSCSEDFFGNVNCTSTGDSGNWSSTTSTDFFGNDNTTIYDNSYGSYGSSSTFSCSYDYFGNYNCN